MTPEFKEIAERLNLDLDLDLSGKRYANTKTQACWIMHQATRTRFEGKTQPLGESMEVQKDGIMLSRIMFRYTHPVHGSGIINYDNGDLIAPKSLTPVDVRNAMHRFVDTLAK